MRGSSSVSSRIIYAFHCLMELFGGSGVVVLLLCIVRIHGVKLQSLHRSLHVNSLTSGGGWCGGRVGGVVHFL